MNAKALAVLDQNGKRGRDRIRFRFLFSGEQRLGGGNVRQSDGFRLPCRFKPGLRGFPRCHRIGRLKSLRTRRSCRS